MNEEKKKHIKKLTSDVIDKRDRHRMLGSRNIFGLTKDERLELDYEYNAAYADMIDAERRLKDYIEP